MTREAWNIIKQSKRFYVNTFRAISRAVVLSLAINVVLILAIGYVFLNKPEPDYYATYGETPPVPLAAMDSPNYTAIPLLANDAETDSAVRTIPR